MKRGILLAAFFTVAMAASAQDLNKSGSLTVWINPASFFQSELSAHVEFRFASDYSAQLGFTYGYGGRAAHAEGDFLEWEPAVKSFTPGLETTHSNWYLLVSGRVRFLFLGGQEYGAGAGFGYNWLAGRVVFNPEIVSQFDFNKGIRLELKPGLGWFFN